MEVNNNPDKLNDLEEHTTNDEEYAIQPWIEKKEKKVFTPSSGLLTNIQQDGIATEEEINAFKSGIGDNDDLFVKTPNKEKMKLSFQYASRLRGKKKHETMIYPEIPFEYGIHYEGEEILRDNEQPYDHRVDAYPGKTVKYSVTQRDPQPTNRRWEVEFIAGGRVRQDTLEYAVKWKAEAAVESVSGAANLFTNARGTYIGPAPPGSIWHKSGNYVREIDNRSHCSGIIAKEFYDWTHYEAEFDFKTIRATGARPDPNAKVVRGSRVYSQPGADDDIIGIIFKAKKNNKDFYMFLWEGDDILLSGRRAANLNGYNVLTGNIGGSYNHTNAENKWNQHTYAVNYTNLGAPNFYNGISLNSTQLGRYNNMKNNQGWGQNHYRVYRVTNGVMSRVNIASRGDGRGWRQEWYSSSANHLKWKNSLKVRVSGRRVRIYKQSYLSGNYKPNNYQLVADFNAAAGFDAGSIGLATFSQAVQFEKITVTRWENLEGRVPSTGWSKYKDPGEKQVSASGTSYVTSSVRSAASKVSGFSGDFEVTSISTEVKDKSVGGITASINGPVKVRTNNPPDAGKIRNIPFRKSGTARITPENISPETAHTVFVNGSVLFSKELQAYLKKTPDIEKIETTTLKVLTPSDPNDDWHLKGERFTMWNRNPEVITTKKDFVDKVYAYQGWVNVLDARKEMGGLQWATYKLDVVDETINDTYDEIELKTDKVYLRTTEWYEGTYPADIKSSGVVTNREHVFVDIPPMPEHYREPNTGEVMYHGYEDVEFLLIQLKPRLTNEVWMGFKSSFDEYNTNITKEPLNIINGRPIIKTNKINDQVEIHCEDWVRVVPWRSGKYIGYGKVNGRRPFFRDGTGKSDMIDVPTDVVFIPDHVFNIQGPFIEVDDERVRFIIRYDKKTVDFYSDHIDAYIWYTDWFSEWKESDETHYIETDEIITIEDPVELNPQDDPYYDIADTIIDDYEVISTNPFVDIWSADVRGKGQGYQGFYYQYPLISHIIAENFQVTGDYHQMIQEYTIKEYMVEDNLAKINIESDQFSVIEVHVNGKEVPRHAVNGYSVSGDEVRIRGSVLEAGTATVKYSIGSYSNTFQLKKSVGKDLTIHHNENQLDRSKYSLSGSTLIIDKSILFMNDWIHIQSYESEEQFKPNQKSYLGDYKGSRIDPDIWFDWKDGSPLYDFVAKRSISPFSVMAIQSPKISFQYDLDMEVIYPKEMPVDISNFTDEWQQWDSIPTEEGGLNGPGEWHGPPEPGYDEVTNLRNQNGYSGWYNPQDVNKTDYTFGFKVESRTDWDDDIYGAAFRWNPETMSGYTFEWNAGGSKGWGVEQGYEGMVIRKRTCTNPEVIGTGARLQFATEVLDHDPEWWDPDATGSQIPNRKLYTHDIKISVVGGLIKVFVNDELKMEAYDEDPYQKGAWGPLTQSNPDTYFWGFWVQEYQRATPNDEPSFRKSITKEVNRPLINENPMIEINLENRIDGIMRSALNSFLNREGLILDDVSIEYFIRNDKSEYLTYFKNSVEIKRTITIHGDSKVYAEVEGQEPPQDPPKEDPVPDKDRPNIPEIDLPEADLSDAFAVSWEGYLYAPETGYYEFNVEVDDAIRMWVNNHLIIDEWDENGSKEYESTIYLEGGKWHPMKVNYAEVRGTAHIFLKWKEPSGYVTRIPEEYIAPYLQYKIKAEIRQETPYPWMPLIHNGYYYFHEKESYLYANKKTIVADVQDKELLISPRPKQGSPILIQSGDTQLRKVNFYDNNWNLTLEHEEDFSGTGRKKYFLQYKDIDYETVIVSLNEEETKEYIFNQDESSLTFNREITTSDIVEVKYILQNSYYVIENEDSLKDEALIVFHNHEDLDKVRIVYEQSEDTPFYRAESITTNPILNHNHRGFLYLTEKTDRKPTSISTNISPKTATSNEKVNLTVRVADRHGNPVPKATVTVYQDKKSVLIDETNEAGEIYFQDRPTSPESMNIVYTAQVEGIENSSILNFYKDDIKERSYIELKAGKSSIIAGSSERVRVYAILRDYAWDVLSGKELVFEIKNSKDEVKEVLKTTDSNGRTSFDLSAEDEVNGSVHITAYYKDNKEGVKNHLYIKVIGG